MGYWSVLCVLLWLCALQLTLCCIYAESSRQGTQHSAAHACLCRAGTQVPSSQQRPDISSLKPNLQLEWDHDKNSHLGSIVVAPGSQRKVWWKCDKCPHGKPHEWEAQVSSRSEGCDCPFCSSIAVCTHNSLATLAPHIAKEWDYAANDLTPDDCTWKSNVTASWECHVCSHQWDVGIDTRVTYNTGCPECYAARRGYKKDGTRTSHPTLAATSHPMMLQYDYALNSVARFDPAKIKCGSHKRVHWMCYNCPKGQVHRWTASPNSRFHGGSGCPCCANKKACKCNSLQTRCPEIAAEWDYSKNAKTPDDYLAYSRDVVWWTSPRRPTWQQSIVTRTIHRLRDASQSAVPPIKRTLQSHVKGSTSWKLIETGQTVAMVVNCRVCPRVLNISCSPCVVYMVLDVSTRNILKACESFGQCLFWHAFSLWRYALNY